MKRIYHGYVNHSVLRGLKKICEIIADNRQTLLKMLAKSGTVTLSTNLDLFGFPDELSGSVTFTNEEEIDAFLKTDLEKRVEAFLDLYGIDPKKDCFLEILIHFIKENGGVYPNPDEMKIAETVAEAKRVSSPSTTTEEEVSPRDILIREVLECAEEIMEARREKNPKSIVVPPEPYPERIHIENDTGTFRADINRSYNPFGNYDSRDYEIIVHVDWNSEIAQIHFHYYADYFAGVIARDYSGENLGVVVVTSSIIAIHKDLFEIARQEGLNIESEIDYDSLSE